jgi:hypothetical protein
VVTVNDLDALIVRAAARILFDTGVRLCDEHDQLAELEGLIGYRASQVAETLYDWLDEAEAAGVIAPLARA